MLLILAPSAKTSLAIFNIIRWFLITMSKAREKQKDVEVAKFFAKLASFYLGCCWIINHDNKLAPDSSARHVSITGVVSYVSREYFFAGKSRGKDVEYRCSSFCDGQIRMKCDILSVYLEEHPQRSVGIFYSLFRVSLLPCWWVAPNTIRQSLCVDWLIVIDLIDQRVTCFIADLIA